MDAAQKRIAAFHAGEKATGSVLRLVYFHTADREPLPNYVARLERVMTDISGFYRDELDGRFGVKTGGLPLERKDGKLVIHRVRGQHPAAHYQHESGNETWGEVRKALAGVFAPEREHVLILYGLCERAPDGRFVFTSPYYGAGWSDQRSGLCHAADCDLLDPALLTQKDQPFVFSEHYYPRMEMTVAKFNSWYLGGLAHELGHGLGFPHDNGGPNEAPGVALRGAAISTTAKTCGAAGRHRISRLPPRSASPRTRSSPSPTKAGGNPPRHGWKTSRHPQRRAS